METKIIKRGDFALVHFSYNDSYFLFYKDFPTWEGKFNKLVDPKFVDYIFELEPDSKKAEGFISELYNWCFSQHEAFEKIPDEIYEEYKQLNNIK